MAVGYPETAGPQDSSTTEAELYNSLVMVNSHGERLAHTRKSFLYYTDETWAREGGGFYGGQVPGLGKVAIGICKFPVNLTLELMAFSLTLMLSRHGYQVSGPPHPPKNLANTDTW